MPKNPHAVSLGRKGGQSTSPAKKAACRANVQKARKAKQDKMRILIAAALAPSDSLA